MSPHGERPASPVTDQGTDASEREDVRTATPPPAWGGPGAQYTEALPQIPLPPKSSVKTAAGKSATRARRPRHRRSDAPAAEPALPAEQQAPGAMPPDATAHTLGPLPMLAAPVSLSGALPPVDRAVPARPPAERPRTDVDRLAASSAAVATAADQPMATDPEALPTNGAVVTTEAVPAQPVSPADGQRMGPLPMLPPVAPQQQYQTQPMPRGLPVSMPMQPVRSRVDGIASLVAWMGGWPVRRLSVGGLIATLGAIVLLIGSFAPFVAYGGSTAALHRLALGGAPDSYPAWSLRAFMFPLSVLPVVLAVVVVAMMAVGVRRSSGAVPLPFGSRQLMVASALGAVAILLGYALSSKALLLEPAISAPAAAGVTVGFGGGGLTMLLAALAMTAGAVIHLMGVGPELAPAPDTTS